MRTVPTLVSSPTPTSTIRCGPSAPSRRRTKARAPRGTMSVVLAGRRRSEAVSQWSACRWEITTASGARVRCGVGPRRRRRWASRSRRTGSVKTMVPPSSTATVACPHQVTFIRHTLRNDGRRWPPRTPLQRRRVVAPAAVEVAVAPLAGAEFARPDHALRREAGLFEGALLRNVLGVGTGLDALHRGMPEEVVAQDRLGPPADAAPAPLRQQRDPDLPVRTGAAVVAGLPGHEAGRGGLLGDLDDEPPVGRAQVAVGGEAAGRRLGVAEAGPFQADEVRLGRETAEQLQILADERPQPDGRLTRDVDQF